MPELLILSPQYIAKNTNGMWAIQNTVLHCAEISIIQTVQNINNTNSNHTSNTTETCSQLAVWQLILDKCCYFVLKNKWGSKHYLSRLWRVSGILNFYHLLQFYLNDVHDENQVILKRALYCFRQVLKFSDNSLDKMQCIQFLVLLHVLSGNIKDVDQFEKKISISNASKIDRLKIWIEEMTDLDMNGDDKSHGKLKIYHFMKHIWNINTNGNDQNSHTIENDFLSQLEAKVSSNMEKIVSSEKSIVTMCNVMLDKQCNWNKCHQRSKKLKKCKKCKLVFYCSKSCQKHDWKLHKKICRRKLSLYILKTKRRQNTKKTTCLDKSIYVKNILDKRYLLDKARFINTTI